MPLLAWLDPCCDEGLNFDVAAQGGFVAAFATELGGTFTWDGTTMETVDGQDFPTFRQAQFS